MTMPEKVAHLRDAAVPVSEIAAHLKISERRVYQILGTTQPKPRATDAQVEEIRRRKRLGDSTRQIAAEMKMSRKTVAKIIGDDAAKAAPALTDEEIAHIELRTATGRSPAEIARELQRSTAGVRAVADHAAQSDWIQDAVIARAEELGLGPYRLAQMTEQRVSEDHIRAFLGREKTMSSAKLQHIFSALRLGIKS
jgi:DNA-binding CsgD family transcriptional regulator